MSTFYADINDSVAAQPGYESFYGAGTWPGIGATLRPYSRDQLNGVLAGGNTYLMKGIGSYLGPSGQIPEISLGGTLTLDRWDLNNPWRMMSDQNTASFNFTSGGSILNLTGGVIQAPNFNFQNASSAFSSTINVISSYLRAGNLHLVAASDTYTSGMVLLNKGSYVYITGAFSALINSGSNGFNAVYNVTDGIHVAANAFHAESSCGCCGVAPTIYSTQTNMVTNRTSGVSSSGVMGSGTPVVTNSQFSWTPSAVPAWDDVNNTDWAAATIGAGILSQAPNGSTGKPNPGNGAPTYTGYETDAWGNARTGIGFMYYGSTGTPTFHISPTFYSFAEVQTNSTTDTTVTVSNTGTAALDMGAMTGLSAPFSVQSDFVSDSTMYNNLDSSTFVLRYHPTVAGASSGTLTIPSNDAGSPYLFQVDGTAETPEPAEPDIEVTPTSRSFGFTPRNVTIDQTVNVSNDGTAGSTLLLGTLSGFSISSPFSLVDDHVSGSAISYHDSSSVVVRYHPVGLGGFSGTLDMTSNDPDDPHFYFQVDGTCQEAIASVSPDYVSFGVEQNLGTYDATITVSNIGNIPLIVGAFPSPALPFHIVDDNVSNHTFNNNGDSSTMVLEYHPTSTGTASGTHSIPSNDLASPFVWGFDGTSIGAAAITVSPTVKHFGGKANLSTTDQTVNVSNSGNVPLIVGTLSGLAAPYSMVNDNVTGKTFYNPSDASTVVVRYHPTAIGFTTDTLIIPSNTTTYNFDVDGTSQEADISVSPTGIDFGLQTIGTSKSQTFTVTNVGNVNLVVQPVHGLSAPFSVANDNVSDATIAPAGTATLSVVFTAADFGYAQGHLIINSNDPDTAAVTVPVEGAGSAPVNVLLSHGVRHDFRADGNRFEIRDYIS